MSQSMTISPSPISRQPEVLSRNDPFSMPVIHCLGFFLGMTASSLSVSILMARSSSMTRAHGLSPGGAARSGSTFPIATSDTAHDKQATMALGILMRCPRLPRRKVLAPDDLDVYLACRFELGESVVSLAGAGKAVAFAQGDLQAIDPFEEILSIGTSLLRPIGDLDIDGT